MKGKDKCKILKDIRRRIAEENEIALVTKECEFKGECKGTCPKCEAEIRYLEEQLERRRKMGKTVACVAISATMLLGATGCYDGIDFPNPFKPETPEVMGEVEYIPEPTNYGELEGDVPYYAEGDAETEANRPECTEENCG